MGFHSVSFGHTKKHGSSFDFLKLLFKEVKGQKGHEESEYIIVTLTPHPDILINGKHLTEFQIRCKGNDNKYEWYEGDDDIYYELNYNTKFDIVYKDRTYSIGMGHCCSYGITLATVADWGDDYTFTLEEIQNFFTMIKELHKDGRLESDTISMTGNCCN